MAKIKHLPGTTLEGGGQLLRLAVGLSALTRTPIEITNIRGNRSGGGGLKLQHLKAVEWLAEACDATVEGGRQGSKLLTFVPNERAQKTQNLRSIIDIGSPGSISLVFQAVLPYIIFAGSRHPQLRHSNGQFRLNIRGGTNVSQSPSFEYIIHVLLPTLRKIGLPPISATLERRGWSTGHTTVGSVNFDITPLGAGETLPAFALCDRGDICAIAAKILAPAACRTTVESEISTRIGDALGDVNIDFEFSDSRDPKRLYLLLIATSANGHRLGSDLLYDLRIKNLQEAARLLVKRVVAQLLSEVEHGGCVDEFMRDQLAVFQSLAAGRCEIDVGRGEDGKYIPPSLHAKTTYWVTNELLGVEFDENGIGDGIGYSVANDGMRSN